MATFINLKVGESYTLTVTRIEEVKRGKWPEYDWHGMGPAGSVIVTTPKAAADRQLEKHLAMNLAQCVGESLTISRTPSSDPNRSWWNLDLAAPAETKPAPVSKRIPSPSDREHYAGDLPGDPESAYQTAPDAPPADKEEDPRQVSRRKQFVAYKALWALCADFQEEVCTRTEVEEGGSLPRKDRIPYDAMSINAMASTIWIQWDKGGLLPR